MEKGEITAFLSLIFVLMISFVTAILESASVQAEKNQARLDMDRAVYSVFGEYQKELLEEYGIFAVEGSYETGNFSEKQLIDRMHYYGASGIWPEVEGIHFCPEFQTFHSVKCSDNIASDCQSTVIFEQHYIVLFQVRFNSVRYFNR